jgi:hypothetical protein
MRMATGELITTLVTTFVLNRLEVDVGCFRKGKDGEEVGR